MSVAGRDWIKEPFNHLWALLWATGAAVRDGRRNAATNPIRSVDSADHITSIKLSSGQILRPSAAINANDDNGGPDTGCPNEDELAS